MQRFIDRTVLITGAGGAIVRAAAQRFAAEGARLALVDRDAGAAQLAKELAAQRRAALLLTAGVADEQALAQAIEQAEAHFGQLHVVFNNAGIGGHDLPVADLSSAQWDEVIAVNLRGVFLGCKYSVPALMRAGG